MFIQHSTASSCSDKDFLYDSICVHILLIIAILTMIALFIVCSHVTRPCGRRETAWYA